MEENNNSVRLGEIIREFNLEVLRKGPEYEDTLLHTVDVNRPGLPLTGFFEHFDTERLLLIGLILSLLDTQTVSRLLGAESGLRGIVIAAIVGCITLIPGFVAMPLAASLVAAGAGYTQVAVFISTLMMVGVATLPMEARYFGRRTTSCSFPRRSSHRFS